MYQAREFAQLAGTTVRTLHHYDRLGLLKPARRSASGYRLYRERDLARLEQIVALKFIGLPLRQIGNLLERSPSGLAEALRGQRRALEQKRKLLDLAIAAVGEAERAAHSGSPPEAVILKRIIEVIEMQNDTDWMMKYYSPEAAAKIEERKAGWTTEMQARAEKDWADLFRDVEASLGEDPAGPRAQALAARWKKLVEGFTGGDPAVTAGLNKLYQDRSNWPQTAHRAASVRDRKPAWEFINRAFAAQSHGGGDR